MEREREREGERERERCLTTIITQIANAQQLLQL